ncbi:MAG: endonuclease/exonuclease/phosphatase [Hirschia sp.]|nr:endonuclease/exonuclease/phosphatase [Hirschia sp.]MBF18792.1 endonuclease/exonuclease/phosphatase [Hirschia sp.]
MMRCDFRRLHILDAARKFTAVSDQSDADAVDRVFNVLSEDDRTLTAQALSASQADICCLQEVENLVTLTAFHNRYLKRWMRRGYSRRILCEGNDTRGIDVALLARVNVTRVVSHADLTHRAIGIEPVGSAHWDGRIFRRDCLEVDIEKEGRTLTLFICHFKSMNGGRLETRPVRHAEALAVRKLIEARFDDPAQADWAVLGDFNDYLEIDGVPVEDHGLGPLIDGGFSVDALMMLQANPMERWTHYYAGGKAYTALDHIFLSPALAARNARARIRLMRAGQPLRVQRFEGHRFPGVGWVLPKASDHCPLSLTLEL